MSEIGSVVVIGAGFSGLVSSLLLSRSGLAVTLVERNERVGPLLRNYNYQGFEVSNGFHFVGGYYPGGALYQSFEHLGINQKLKPLEVNKEAFDCFSGITKEDIILPVGPESVRSVMEASFPRSRQALTEYFQVMQEVFQEFSFFSIEEYYRKASSKLASVSLNDFLKERKAEDSLIAFLSVYSELLLGLSAREVSLLMHLLGVGAYFSAVHTFQGGGGALIGALEDRLNELGVQILTGFKVVEILSGPRRQFAGLRIRSLRGDQEMILDADACLSTIHPKRFVSLLPRDTAYRLYSQRISSCCDTRAVHVLHLAVEKDVANQFKMSYHKMLRDESGYLKHQFTLLPDITNGQDSSATEKRVSVILTAWENDPRKGCPDRREAECYKGERLPLYAPESFEPEDFPDSCSQMVRRLEGVFPQLKGKYRILNALSPCHFDRLNATWQGSIYGIKCSFDRVGLLPVGPMKSLFLAGQSITAPGIFGTLVSAYLACGRIMKRNFA